MGTEMYAGFGLHFQSELSLPELRCVDTTRPADVVVRLGAVPEALADAVEGGICYQTAPGRALICLPGIASFLVADGREVTIDPAPGIDEDTLRLFLLGLCVGLVLHQRGTFVLHAAAVARDGVCLALAGPSSVGKSTLAAAFLRRGYTLVTDEVCAVVLRDGLPHVVPGYPALLLWRRALDRLDLFDETCVRVRPELEKHVYPVPTRFAGQPVRLSHVYTLATHNREDVVVEPLQGFARFNALLDDTFREPYLHGLGLARQRQRLCAAVAPHLAVRRLTWPQRWSDLDEAVALIESDLSPVSPPEVYSTPHPSTYELSNA